MPLGLHGCPKEANDGENNQSRGPDWGQRQKRQGWGNISSIAAHARPPPERRAAALSPTTPSASFLADRPDASLEKSRHTTVRRAPSFAPELTPGTTGVGTWIASCGPAPVVDTPSLGERRPTNGQRPAIAQRPTTSGQRPTTNERCFQTTRRTHMRGGLPSGRILSLSLRW